MEDDGGDGVPLGGRHVWDRRRLGYSSRCADGAHGDSGGISEKPGVVDGQITIREYLSITLSFDHDLVDGAPAARFTQRLKELIESGYGLGESTVVSELVGAKGGVL